MRAKSYQNATGSRPTLEATKLPGPDDRKSCTDITYYVIGTGSQGEKRALRRRQTRLRSGKVLDPSNALLVECQIYDRTEKVRGFAFSQIFRSLAGSGSSRTCRRGLPTHRWSGARIATSEYVLHPASGRMK